MLHTLRPDKSVAVDSAPGVGATGRIIPYHAPAGHPGANCGTAAYAIDHSFWTRRHPCRRSVDESIQAIPRSGRRQAYPHARDSPADPRSGIEGRSDPLAPTGKRLRHGPPASPSERGRLSLIKHEAVHCGMKRRLAKPAPYPSVSAAPGSAERRGQLLHARQPGHASWTACGIVPRRPRSGRLHPQQLNLNNGIISSSPRPLSGHQQSGMNGGITP